MNYVANILRQNLTAGCEDGKASKEEQSVGSEENTTVGLLRDLCATPAAVDAPGRKQELTENMQ